MQETGALIYIFKFLVYTVLMISCKKYEQDVYYM